MIRSFYAGLKLAKSLHKIILRKTARWTSRSGDLLPFSLPTSGGLAGASGADVLGRPVGINSAVGIVRPRRSFPATEARRLLV